MAAKKKKATKPRKVQFRTVKLTLEAIGRLQALQVALTVPPGRPPTLSDALIAAIDAFTEKK